ncbi:MAG TPA: cytochrome c [Vicinamibacterales bacterium]|nr:cytochrome c [Vicinamibacterales bacterium]
MSTGRGGTAAGGLAAMLLVIAGAAPAPRAQPAPATPPARSVWDGVYSEAQAKRGAAVYQQHCAGCHGSGLEGGESAGPLAGAAFTANWNGVSVGDLFERTRVSMPLDRPGTLTRQQIADVLAYVFSANGFPAGKTELARQPELLKSIRLDAARPAHH